MDFFPARSVSTTVGQIAAPMRLSGCFAMGGEVMTERMKVCWPERATVRNILKFWWWTEKSEAGGILVGGIYSDSLPKLGYSVSGKYILKKFTENDTCEEEDCLNTDKTLGRYC